MNIAIIGAGNVGKALTGSAIRAGHSVTVSSKNGESARALAQATGARAAASDREAVEAADVVVLAIPYGAVDEVLGETGAALAGKVLVDATNPIKPDYSGLATNGTSGAEGIQSKAPGARVVKAFNTAFAARQADPEVAAGCAQTATWPATTRTPRRRCWSSSRPSASIRSTRAAWRWPATSRAWPGSTSPCR